MAAAFAGLALLCGAPPALAATFNGVSGDAAGTQVRWTVTGLPTLKQTDAVSWNGTHDGTSTITLSGEARLAIPGGGKGGARVSASIGGPSGAKASGWPLPVGADRAEVDGSVTVPFSVSYTPTKADRQPAANIDLTIVMQACSEDQFLCPANVVGFGTYYVKPGAAPTVKAWKIDKILRIGKRYPQYLAVDDKSGKANIFTDLYDGGTKIGSANSPGLVTAKGQKRRVYITPTANRKGPLEFCVWATNASGATSRKAPRSACKWIDVLVPIQNVSNQCGGAGWDKVVQFQNWVGNTSSFYDSRLNESFTADFTDACNLHDAGYGGHTVRDILDGKRGDRPIVNFRLSSRSEVDRKFLEDMQKVCRRDIPKRASGARKECIDGRGRYNAVRGVGGYFFDADLRTPGTQQEGHRRNDGPLDAITWLP